MNEEQNIDTIIDEGDLPNLLDDDNEQIDDPIGGDADSDGGEDVQDKNPVDDINEEDGEGNDEDESTLSDEGDVDDSEIYNFEDEEGATNQEELPKQEEPKVETVAKAEYDKVVLELEALKTKEADPIVQVTEDHTKSTRQIAGMHNKLRQEHTKHYRDSLVNIINNLQQQNRANPNQDTQDSINHLTSIVNKGDAFNKNAVQLGYKQLDNSFIYNLRKKYKISLAEATGVKDDLIANKQGLDLSNPVVVNYIKGEISQIRKRTKKARQTQADIDKMTEQARLKGIEEGKKLARKEAKKRQKKSIAGIKQSGAGKTPTGEYIASF